MTPQVIAALTSSIVAIIGAVSSAVVAIKAHGKATDATAQAKNVQHALNNVTKGNVPNGSQGN